MRAIGSELSAEISLIPDLSGLDWGFPSGRACTSRSSANEAGLVIRKRNTTSPQYKLRSGLDCQSGRLLRNPANLHRNPATCFAIHEFMSARIHKFTNSRSDCQTYQPIHSKSARYAFPIQMLRWTSQAESRNFAAVSAVCGAGY